MKCMDRNCSILGGTIRAKIYAGSNYLVHMII